MELKINVKEVATRFETKGKSVTSKVANKTGEVTWDALRHTVKATMIGIGAIAQAAESSYNAGKGVVEDYRTKKAELRVQEIQAEKIHAALKDADVTLLENVVAKFKEPKDLNQALSLEIAKALLIDKGKTAETEDFIAKQLLGK
jgi:hypothetical protein